jgi:hypothetical protein
MMRAGLAFLLLASFCYAQGPDDFQPASTNVWDAQSPRVDSAGRVQIRVKAPDATKSVEVQDQELTPTGHEMVVPPFSVNIYSFPVQ